MAKKEEFVPLEPDVVRRIKTQGTKAQNLICKKMAQFGWRISDVYVNSDDPAVIAVGMKAPGNKAIIYPDGERRMCSGATQKLVLRPGWTSHGEVLLQAKKAAASDAKFEALCAKYDISEEDSYEDRKRDLAYAILDKMLKV